MIKKSMIKLGGEIIPTLSAMFKLIDNFSGPAQAIVSASNNVTKAIESASQSADNINVSAANMSSGTAKASQAMNQMNKHVDQGYTKSEELSKAWEEVGTSAQGAGNKIRKVGNECSQAASKASGLTGSLGGLLKKLAGLMAIKQGMSITDNMTNLQARLNNMNDGLQTTYELQQKIFASANRARGVYTGMANAVARLGTLASDAFTSNDEIIAFSELLQKSFTVSGASASEQAAAMTQLSQAMAAGRLQGDEYVSIMENAPAVIQAITKYLGVSKGKLKEMSSEGAITADIIKAAMFASADDINAKFETMPMTFGGIWTRIKNGGLQAFQAVINKVNDLINTDGVQRAINAVVRGFGLAASAVSWLIDVIVNNWPLIESILMIVSTVYLVNMIINIYTMVGALWAAIPPLLAQAVAWLAVYWPVLLVIAIIILAISAIRQFGVSWEEILGFVGGVIGTFATLFYNIFVGMWNFIADFINFFGNCFKDPVSSIKILFLEMAKNIIGLVKTMVQGIEDLINKIPGVSLNISGGLDSVYDDLSAKISSIKDESEWTEFVAKKEYVDYSDGWSKGQEMGENLATTVGDAFGDIGDIMNGFDTPDASAGYDVDWSSFGADGAVPIEGTGNSTGKSVDVDISDENLNYIKDIAEKEYQVVVKQDVLAPNLNVKFGDVRETADVRKLQKELERIMEEEISTNKEGDD